MPKFGRLLTVAVHNVSYEVPGGQSDLGAEFTLVLLFPLPFLIPPDAPN